MKNLTKKLTLNKETLTTLGSAELQRVGGGALLWSKGDVAGCRWILRIINGIRYYQLPTGELRRV